MHNKQGIESAIEMICTQGCSEVYQVIRKLEKKQDVPLLKHANLWDKRLILKELKSIMAVYDAREDSVPQTRMVARKAGGVLSY